MASTLPAMGSMTRSEIPCVPGAQIPNPQSLECYGPSCPPFQPTHMAVRAFLLGEMPLNCDAQHSQETRDSVRAVILVGHYLRKLSSSGFNSSAWVQLMPWGPPATTKSRLPLTALFVRIPVAEMGRIRSASP